MKIESILEQPDKLKAANEILKTNRIFAFTLGQNPKIPEGRSMNPPQAKLFAAWDDPKYKVFGYFGGNRMGKTTSGVILAFATMFGEWPWSGVRLPFIHNKPRRCRYVGQGWETHIRTVVEPALKYWWPSSHRVETRKNNQGVDANWLDVNTGSTLELMSNSQSSDTFEGWDGDLVVYDEPPARDVRIACARGLVDREGRELFVATLIKEAWINREIVRARMKNGEPDPSVFVVTGDTRDNVGYGLTEAGVQQFEKSLSDAEIDARIHGKPSFLSQLVCPNFERDRNVVGRFPIPLSALIDIQIDFHPSKKWAVLFVATLKNGFKYVVDEMWEHGAPQYIAEQIVRKCKERTYLRINSCEIDPLAKGGEGNQIDVYRVVESALAAHNIQLGTASKDKEVGISILNDLLYTENKMPGLLFFKDCSKTIMQVEDWAYDKETLKPSKEDDDFVECLYRAALKNTQWYEEFKYVNNGKSVVL